MIVYYFFSNYNVFYPCLLELKKFWMVYKKNKLFAFFKIIVYLSFRNVYSKNFKFVKKNLFSFFLKFLLKKIIYFFSWIVSI